MDTDAERGNRRSRFLLLGGALAVAVFLAGCATKPASGPRVLLEISSVRAEALDQHRTLFSFVLTAAAYTGGKALESVSASYASLSLDGASEAASCLDEPLRIPAARVATCASRFRWISATCPGILSRCRYRGTCPGTLAAELRSPGAAGDILLASAEAKGSYPLIREPELTITSIILVKHELINVLLELVWMFGTPTPLRWISPRHPTNSMGKAGAGPTAAWSARFRFPRAGTAEVRLPIVLNFTETGRNLFRSGRQGLKVVRYRLAGEARVVTFRPLPAGIPR
jgi:hypothetical protein